MLYLRYFVRGKLEPELRVDRCFKFHHCVRNALKFQARWWMENSNHIAPRLGVKQD